MAVEKRATKTTEKIAVDTIAPKKTCFVITPIGNDGDEIRRETNGLYDAAILPALVYNGFVPDDVTAAHKIFTSGRIDKQLVQRIIDDTLVIVNLTENNPNVMYELAIRHSIGKPLIIIARDDTDLPFDIKSARTFFYKNDPQGALDLRDSLIKCIGCIDTFEPDNVIYDALKATKEKTIFDRPDEIMMSPDIVQILVSKMNEISVAVRSSNMDPREFEGNGFNMIEHTAIFSAAFEFLPDFQLSTENNTTFDILDDLLKEIRMYIAFAKLPKPFNISIDHLGEVVKVDLYYPISYSMSLNSMKKALEMVSCMRLIELRRK